MTERSRNTHVEAAVGRGLDRIDLILFFQARLFGDMSLQLVYVVLGLLGWYWWVRGGPAKTELPVARVSAITLAALGLLVIVSTGALTLVFQRFGDTAPLWDALTTVLSLIAQYMLTRKLIENWYVWICADVIYVWLYTYKHLYLTAGLYAMFIALCVAGLMRWRATLPDPAPVAVGPPLEAARV